MPFLTRLTLTAFAAFTLLGLTSWQAVRSLRAELGRLPDLVRLVHHERERSGWLDEESARIAVRSQAKSRLFAELAAGQLSLPQGAARFRELCADVPQVRDALQLFYRSGSEEERLCRFLIDCVETEADSPTQRRAIVRRLNAELRARLRSGEPLLAQ